MKGERPKWFVQWLIYTYLVHIIAQIAAVQAFTYLYGYDLTEWLKANRHLISVVLLLHFVCYFVAKLASLERDYLDNVARDELKDD